MNDLMIAVQECVAQAQDRTRPVVLESQHRDALLALVSVRAWTVKPSGNAGGTQMSLDTSQDYHYHDRCRRMELPELFLSSRLICITDKNTADDFNAMRTEWYVAYLAREADHIRLMKELGWNALKKGIALCLVLFITAFIASVLQERLTMLVLILCALNISLLVALKVYPCGLDL